MQDKGHGTHGWPADEHKAKAKRSLQGTDGGHMCKHTTMGARPPAMQAGVQGVAGRGAPTGMQHVCTQRRRVPKGTCKRAQCIAYIRARDEAQRHP
ncbi:hypothetical protein H6P81_010410 [Aristolochia fimbriata]|uniref:Uncharacterized protein n=1 Tax=Aristolochia fimbriata TaxID=158543 RepID=A0AAV7EQS3_ARIFI|nr:hypothetical protein H6P81_010410 [Aristolochia fimbriata]